MFHLICLILIPVVFADDGVFDVRYPSVVIAAQRDGNISVQSGSTTHDLYVLPGPDGGSVFLEGEDLLHIIEMARSLPPVWSRHAHVGFFGTFTGEEKVNIKLEAEDPEGGGLRFEVVAGLLPPGITLNGVTGHVVGVVPDVTDRFSFTIRVIDSHDKYADAVFKMETIEYDHCLARPCQHSGQCTDTKGSFSCNCTEAYGGEKCELTCRSNAVHVQSRSSIADAQMSAQLSLSSYLASNGRYGASSYGWCGQTANSWLQVDLDKLTRIYRVQTQGYSSSQYTSAYTLSYSVDGHTFQTVNSTSGVYSFSASYSRSPTVYSLPVPVNARFVRFHPTSYGGSHPCLKVELFGCRVYDLHH